MPDIGWHENTARILLTGLLSASKHQNPTPGRNNRFWFIFRNLLHVLSPSRQWIQHSEMWPKSQYCTPHFLKQPAPLHLMLICPTSYKLCHSGSKLTTLVFLFCGNPINKRLPDKHTRKRVTGISIVAWQSGHCCAMLCSADSNSRNPHAPAACPKFVLCHLTALHWVLRTLASQGQWLQGQQVLFSPALYSYAGGNTVYRPLGSERDDPVSLYLLSH